MNEQKRIFESREFDLVDFLKYILELWRGIVIISLICGLLVPFVVYSIDKKKSTEINHSVIKKTIYSAEDVLSSTDVGSCTSMFYLWKKYADYASNSPVMDFDCYNAQKLVLSIYITGDGADYNSLREYYANAVIDERALSELAGVLRFEGDPILLSDLIYISDGVKDVLNSDNSMVENSHLRNDRLFFLIAYLPGETDEREVEDVLIRFIDEIKHNVSIQFGDHGLLVASSETTRAPINEIINKQADIMENYYKYRDLFEKSYYSYPVEVQAQIDKEVDKIEKGELSFEEIKDKYALINQNYISTDQYETNSEELNKEPRNWRSYLRYGLIGVALGMSIYIFVVFVCSFFSIHFLDAKDAKNTLGLRLYGESYSYPYFGVRAILHDKMVYRWRHKNTMKSDEIAEAIAVKAKRCSEKKYTCLVIDNANTKASDSINAVRDLLSKQQIEFDIKYSMNKSAIAKDEEIMHFSPVIISVVSRNTKLSQTSEILTKLEDYCIPVVGMLFFEC